MVASLPFTTLAGEVRVTVEGIRSTRGSVVIGLYDSPETFARALVPSDGFLNDPARFGAAALRTNVALASTVVFGNLQPGRYAAIAFHDVNGSGVLDRSFLGVPIEPYGFSNTAPRFYRPPTFAEAAIMLDGNNTTIQIDLITP